MFLDLGSLSPWLLLALGLPLAAALLRRVPVIGRLVSVASWIALLALVAMLVDDRARLSPWFDKAARLLNLDRQQVVGSELRIRMSPDGHFWAEAAIDGVERRMLIDSGATISAISTGTAAAAGMEVREGAVPILLRTANGTIRAQSATVNELGLGNIVARDLSVVVSPAFGETNVLGMNFLSRLKSWRVEGATLILVPHHPQAVEAGPKD